MDVTVEADDGSLRVHSPEQEHTVMTLMKQAVWDAGGKAGYDKGHPYRGEATLVVNADDPEAVLQDAIDDTQEKLDALADAFSA